MTFNKKVGALAALSSLVLVSAVSANDGLQVGGFVDPQMTYVQDVGLTAIMNDGAIYMSKTLGEGAATFDLAFGDIQSTAGVVLREDAGLFSVGTSAKSQAFVAYKYNNGFSWKFGQFDGIFGKERNDTVDVFYTSQGLAYGLQPTVHQALLVGYDVSNALAVHAYVGGSDGSGLVRKTGPAPFLFGNGSPQIGAKVAYNDGFRLSVGGWMESERFAADASGMFINVMAGMDFGDLSLDVEYDMLSTGVDNVDSATGLAAYLGYSLGETTKLGARFSSTNNTTDGDSDAKDGLTQITFGPSFAMTKDLNVKINVSYDMVAATEENTVGGALAATYRF